MKLIKKTFTKDGDGEVVLRAEEPEDMWHAYHLISVGDAVRTTTYRKIQSEGALGNSQSEKIKITVTIAVESVDFDPNAEVPELRLAGKNCVENQVPLLLLCLP